MKRCYSCEQEKPKTDFHKNSSTKDGLQSSCKNCRHVKRVAKWEISAKQEVTRTRNGKVQHYTRGKNHGESKTPLYRRWKSMRERCHNPKSQNYAFYGGKGIAVCPEWNLDFFAFKKWALEAGYSSELELDRVNPNMGYSPENCRWLGKRENIKRARMGISTEVAVLLGKDAKQLGISQDHLIATIVEEYYSQRLAAQALGGDA